MAIPAAPHQVFTIGRNDLIKLDLAAAVETGWRVFLLNGQEVTAAVGMSGGGARRNSEPSTTDPSSEAHSAGLRPQKRLRLESPRVMSYGRSRPRVFTSSVFGSMGMPITFSCRWIPRHHHSPPRRCTTSPISSASHPESPSRKPGHKQRQPACHQHRRQRPRALQCHKKQSSRGQLGRHLLSVHEKSLPSVVVAPIEPGSGRDRTSAALDPRPIPRQSSACLRSGPADVLPFVRMRRQAGDRSKIPSIVSCKDPLALWPSPAPCFFFRFAAAPPELTRACGCSITRRCGH